MATSSEAAVPGPASRPTAMRGVSQPKKLKIKPLKARRLPKDFAENTWSKLQAAIQAVFAERQVSYSFEDLYRVRCSRPLARRRDLPLTRRD